MDRRQDYLALPAALLPVAASLAAVTVGSALVVAPHFAFLLAFVPVVLFMATRPATAWVGSAVVVAVAARGLVGLHVIPGYVQFAHIPLAWGALCVALMRRRPQSRLGHRCLIGLAILAFAVMASTVLNNSQPIRGPVYYALLAEPFAIVAALLLDPPNDRERRLLMRICVALVAVQVPIAYLQAATLGFGDSVQGTLYGSGAGAHVVAALVVVGACWIVGSTRATFSPISLSILAVLVGVVLIADAKQVAFVLPAVAVAQARFSARTLAIALIAAAAVFAVIRFPTLNQGYAVPYIDRALNWQTGKQAAASMIWRDATNDAGTFIFGQGPAETVSRTAYQTVPEYQKAHSSLDVLGLEPAQTAIKAEYLAAAAVRRTGRATSLEPFDLASFDSGTSSGVGLFGDLGLFGFVAYGGLFATILLAVRRGASAEAFAAASGFAMLLILGFLLDWWEEPPLTVFLGALAGLALTNAKPEPTRSPA